MLRHCVSPARRSIGALLGLLLAAVSASASSLELKLEDVRVPGGGFSFEVKDAEPLDALPIRPRDNHIRSASTPHYSVYLDLNSIEFALRGSYFRYGFYVVPKPGTPGQPTSFEVVGEPTGPFLAQMVEVEFEIPGEVSEFGEIKVPIFSLESPSYLAQTLWEEPEEVELPGAKVIPLQLKNQSTTIPLSIKNIRQPSLQDFLRESRLRLRDSDQFREIEITPAGALNDQLVLSVVPSPQAFRKVLFSRSGKPEHASIKAYLDYSPPWGPAQMLEVVVPVRFVPSVSLLFLAVGLGTMLGSFIPVVAGRRKRSRWLQAFGASLLVAIVVELVAMLLVGKLDSEFRIVGFELDPFELLPAALIGVSMGLLGFRSYDFLRKLLPEPDKQAG